MANKEQQDKVQQALNTVMEHVLANSDRSMFFLEADFDTWDNGHVNYLVRSSDNNNIITTSDKFKIGDR